jgi:Ulp1 family protease
MLYIKLSEPPGQQKRDVYSRFNNMKKWKSKDDIFKKDYIIVAIHEKVHFFFLCYVNLAALLKDNIAFHFRGFNEISMC